MLHHTAAKKKRLPSTSYWSFKYQKNTFSRLNNNHVADIAGVVGNFEDCLDFLGYS